MSHLFYSSHKTDKNIPKQKLTKHISFRVGTETFAVDILKIHEIVSYRSLTDIPSLPEIFEGVIDHKESVIPVIDLRKKFGQKNITHSKFNVILILDIGGRMMGTIVDSVTDVIAIAHTDIQPPPRLSSSLRKEFIKGMIRTQEKSFIILLDMDSILNEHELLEMDRVEN